jgi:hypothetical protein
MIADYSQDINPAYREGAGYETMIYGVISLVVLAALGVMGRRWYSEVQAKTNIKKEINKRFRFGGNNDEESKANRDN